MDSYAGQLEDLRAATKTLATVGTPLSLRADTNHMIKKQYVLNFIALNQLRKQKNSEFSRIPERCSNLEYCINERSQYAPLS